MDGRRFYCVVNQTAYNTSHSLEERSASFLMRVLGEEQYEDFKGPLATTKHDLSSSSPGAQGRCDRDPG